jgi:hypothetical protein
MSISSRTESYKAISYVYTEEKAAEIKNNIESKI